MHIRPALAALALACVLVPAAEAQAVRCYPWAAAFKGIYEEYGELPAFISVAQNGAVITFTVNPESRSWTMWSQISPETACMIAAGTDWGAPPQSVIDGVKAKAGRGT